MGIKGGFSFFGFGEPTVRVEGVAIRKKNGVMVHQEGGHAEGGLWRNCVGVVVRDCRVGGDSGEALGHAIGETER